MRNELVAAFRRGATQHEWLAAAERVYLNRGEILCRRNTIAEAAYFPEGCVLSHTLLLPDTSRAHVGLTGYEGVVGERAFPIVRACLTDVVVAVPGAAWRAQTDILRHQCESNARIAALLEQHAEFRFAETTINAACVALHPVDRRLCSLLLWLGHLTGGHLQITHRLVGFMLSTTRPTVTRCVDRLTRDGVVVSRNGAIVIADRARLLAGSCGCYHCAASYLARWIDALRAEPGQRG